MDPVSKSPKKKSPKKGNNFAKKKVKYVTFAEMRELQRIKERSHLGPADTQYLQPFGSDKKGKMTFGSKTDYTKQDFFTSQRVKSYENNAVGPGSTEYMKPFGTDVHHKMHFGKKE